MKIKKELMLNFNDFKPYNSLQLLEEIDSLNKKINDHRPLNQEIVERVLQKLRLNWNYHSNAIEGNVLNYGETVALIMHGLTAKGKPLKDHLDIKGHNEGVTLLFELIRGNKRFNQKDIRELHKIILKEPYENISIDSRGKMVKRKISIGSYKTKPNHVITKTGEKHYYTDPQFVGSEMTKLFDWLDDALEKNILHPVIIASVLHHKFTEIHPFDDGNGRLARILMNYVLMKFGMPPAVIPISDREKYYGALSEADGGSYESLINIISDNLITSMNLQMSAINGENISSLEDLDKEIALFKSSLTPGDRGEITATKELVDEIFTNSVSVFFCDLEKRLRNLDELFKSINVRYLCKLNDTTPRIYDNCDSFKKGINEALNSNDIVLRFIEFQYQFVDIKAKLSNERIEIPLSFQFNEYLYEFNAGKFNEKLSFNKTYDIKFDEEERNELIRIIVKSVLEKIGKLK